MSSISTARFAISSQAEISFRIRMQRNQFVAHLGCRVTETRCSLLRILPTNSSRAYPLSYGQTSESLDSLILGLQSENLYPQEARYINRLLSICPIQYVSNYEVVSKLSYISRFLGEICLVTNPKRIKFLTII